MVRRITDGSPACAPHAMFADVMFGMTCSSVPIGQGPNDSPMSQLMSMCIRVEVRGPRTEDRGPRFEVRGPRTEDRGPRFEVRGSEFRIVRGRQNCDRANGVRGWRLRDLSGNAVKSS